jgi:hypothetical protein
MRILRYLIAITLFCGLTAAAKAAQVNFQVIVIDPQLKGTPIYSTANPFTITWGSCSTTPAPTFDGCFTGENATGHSITSLTLFVADVQNTASDPCPKLSLSIFSTSECMNTSGGYLLYFTGGSIPSGDGDNDEDDEASIFTIAEDGVSHPNDVLKTTATFNSPAPATTPEPDSLLLLATGVLTGGGVMLGDWRRRMLAARPR